MFAAVMQNASIKGVPISEGLADTLRCAGSSSPAEGVPKKLV